MIRNTIYSIRVFFNLITIRIFFCTTLLLAPFVAADVANSTFISDKEMLQSMGFYPDAENVYVANDMLHEKISAYDADVTSLTTPTTGVDYAGVSAKEFVGRSNSTGTQWTYTTSGSDLSRNGSERFADAQIEVPTGATLTFFRVWVRDTNAASNMTIFLFEQCQPGFAAGPITSTTLATLTSVGSAGDQSLLAFLNRPVNNRDCIYLARARFDATGSSLRLQKVRLQFNR